MNDSAAQAFPSLRSYMKRKDMNQEQFAELVGVTQPTVSDWLAGKSQPSLFNLKKISEETEIPLRKLIDEMIAVA